MSRPGSATDRSSFYRFECLLLVIHRASILPDPSYLNNSPAICQPELAHRGASKLSGADLFRRYHTVTSIVSLLATCTIVVCNAKWSCSSPEFSAGIVR